ncbi:uncharacterized protein LOC112141672 [Oryzias melastigma]|uniref:uncharacterized protein LOC112141672 n=1 Tax=Oryzias melastigma TaxID=30732 RepID=UPI00168D5468|nr:uncharacterized protein LOC112141672 [Oryzias melastigma]
MIYITWFIVVVFSTDASLMCVFKNKVKEQPEPQQIKEQEELCCSLKEEQLVLKQEITSECNGIFVTQFEDLSENNICKEKTEAELLLWKQERSSCLDGEEEPELPQIKEEWEEVNIIEEGKRLDGHQKTDGFIGTEHYQESLNSNSEPSESPDLEDNAQIADSDYVTVQLDPPSDESSHFCEICGKFYIRSYNLKNHMKTHKGTKTVFRKICPKPSVMYLVWPST